MAVGWSPNGNRFSISIYVSRISRHRNGSKISCKMNGSTMNGSTHALRSPLHLASLPCYPLPKLSDSINHPNPWLSSFLGALKTMSYCMLAIFWGSQCFTHGQSPDSPYTSAVQALSKTPACSLVNRVI